jgi:hypothetical protein
MHTLSLRLKIIHTHCYHAAIKTIRSICAAVTHINPAPERMIIAVFGAAFPSFSPFWPCDVIAGCRNIDFAVGSLTAHPAAMASGWRKISKSEWFVLPGYLQYDIYYHKNAAGSLFQPGKIGFDVVTSFFRSVYRPREQME